MAEALHRIQSIHNPTLRGEPLVILPEGLLVRWPDPVFLPEIGTLITATAVVVPMYLQKAVLTFLFSASALARCDAARQIAEIRGQRQRILYRLLGESMVQKMITSAERMTPELRSHIEAQGKVVSLRKVFSVVYTLTPKAAVAAFENSGGCDENFSDSAGI